MTGHFTQVVWKDSVHVGCGVRLDCGGMTSVVCRYNSPGNFNNNYLTQVGRLTSSGACSSQTGYQTGQLRAQNASTNASSALAVAPARVLLVGPARAPNATKMPNATGNATGLARMHAQQKTPARDNALIPPNSRTD